MLLNEMIQVRIKAIASCACAMESTHLGCSYHTGTATEPTNDSMNCHH